MANAKALFTLALLVAAVFVANVLTNGGLFAMFKPGWRAPAQGELGSQAICKSSCDCPLAESCVDGTCRVWGCVVSPIGRGGCASDAQCKDKGGYGVCVRKVDPQGCTADQ